MDIGKIVKASPLALSLSLSLSHTHTHTHTFCCETIEHQLLALGLHTHLRRVSHRALIKGEGEDFARDDWSTVWGHGM